jgi:hypothetical protein
MRRFALVVGLSLVLAAGTGRSQDGGKDEPSPASQLAQGMVELLKSEIDLRDDQVPLVSAVLEKGMAHLLANMAAEAQGQQGDDADIRSEILDGLKGVLNEGQCKELEGLVQEFDTQTGRFELGLPDELDPAAELDLGPLPDNAPVKKADLWLEPDLASTARLEVKVENILLLSEEEKKVVEPRVLAVIEARRALRDARHERRTGLGVALHAGAKEDEVRERLHGFRATTAELEKKLAKTEEQLREILTLEQEARLVAIGILD